MFYNIAEENNEDAEETIRELCAIKLDIGEAIKTVKIDRAHRMGKRTENKCRPLVVKFNFYKDKEYIEAADLEYQTNSPGDPRKAAKFNANFKRSERTR